MTRIKEAAVGLVATAIVTFGPIAMAQQIPGQLPDPSSYQGSMEQQRREAESAQQVQQQNEAMQQRLNESYQSYAPGGAGAAGAPGGGSAPPPLKSKPLLPAAKNPLLGRWQQTAGKPLELGLMGLFPGTQEFVNAGLAGGCQSIFGKGMVAFGPGTYSWVAPDGHEEILNHVEYRSDGPNVIVIPSDPQPMPLIFGFPSHDHAVVAILGCTMQRAAPGAKPSPATARATPAAPVAPAAQAGQAILNLTVGEVLPDRFSAVPAGTQIWLTPHDPDASLVKAGFVPAPGGQPIEMLFAACKLNQGGSQESCNRGVQAMFAGALGVASTDSEGHAQTGAVAPGRYYLVGQVPYKGHSLMPGANAVTLNPQNGSISH